MRIIKIISILFLFSFTLSAQLQQNDKYFIKLVDGKIIYGNSEIKDPFLGKSYVMIDSTKYYLKDIAQVIKSKGYFLTYKSGGLFSTPNLVKRTTEGKIDLYSDYVTSYSGGYMGPNGMMVGNFPVTSYQEILFTKDKINLFEINYSNLRDQLSDNPVSVEYLNKYRTLNYFKYGLGIIGIATIIAGISQIDKEKGLDSGAKSTIVIGAVVTNLAWIPSLMQGNTLDDAIAAYNK